MAKYSFELKREIVHEYLSGKNGFKALSAKYSIPSKYEIEHWVHAYERFGDEGLRRSRKKEEYSFEFKLHVVELYLTTETSYQELALDVGITNPTLIARWVNDYRIIGIDALKPKRKGRRKQVDKNKAKAEITATSEGAELLKQLEEENLMLRIENAYLKEARRLRLEEEALLKERRELYTASEENSN